MLLPLLLLLPPLELARAEGQSYRRAYLHTKELLLLLMARILYTMLVPKMKKKRRRRRRRRRRKKRG